MTVFEMIEAQQKGHEGTTVFAVGRHLADICRADPACAAIVAEDLLQKGMGIADCEKKIHALADKIHKEKKTNRVGIDPAEAEKIIREFYGLPMAAPEQQTAPTKDEVETAILDLDELLGL